VEKGLQLEVPPRAQVIRIMMDELTRIASHCLWWGAFAMDVGALTPFFHAFREREMINVIMEETCGTRLTMNYMVPGGVMADLHPNFQKRVKEFIKVFKTKLPEYDELVTNNSNFYRAAERRWSSLEGRCCFIRLHRPDSKRQRS
jgi:NADH-quinone oxidoreductase subunit D/NADH-quinone oxidoreductase subunit C/D